MASSALISSSRSKRATLNDNPSRVASCRLVADNLIIMIMNAIKHHLSSLQRGSFEVRSITPLSYCITRRRYRQNHSSSVKRWISASTELPNDSTLSRLPPNFLSTLQSRYPDLHISTNPYDLESHGHGESYHPSSPPDAVIYPSNAEQIRDILSLCCREAESTSEAEDREAVVDVVSVIPYGAGTSVEGHLNMLIPKDDEIIHVPTALFAENDGSDSYRKVKVCRRGGISIDMSNFQQIGEVETGDLFVRVGAGVTRKTLNESLRWVNPLSMFHCSNYGTDKQVSPTQTLWFTVHG
jgi:hypothetical protein